MLKLLLPFVISINAFAMHPHMKGGDSMHEKRKEMKEFAQQAFTKADANKDGVLNPVEFSSFHAEMEKKHTTGRPTSAELFTMMDVNKDGMLSENEIRPARKRRK